MLSRFGNNIINNAKINNHIKFYENGWWYMVIVPDKALYSYRNVNALQSQENEYLNFFPDMNKRALFTLISKYLKLINNNSFTSMSTITTSSSTSTF